MAARTTVRNVRVTNIAGVECDVRYVPKADITQIVLSKKIDRLAAVSPKSDLVFGLCGWGALPLPAPAEQTQRAEAGGEEWK
jgi:hypothetical protein